MDPEPPLSTTPAVRRRLKLDVLIVAAAAGLTTLAVYMLVVGQAILLPLVIAIFVSYLIHALAAAVSRINIAGWQVPTSVGYLTALTLLVVLVWGLIRLVMTNAGQVMEAAPVYEQNLLRIANQGAAWVGMDEMDDVRVLLQSVNVSDMVRNVTFGLTRMVGSVGTIAIYTLFLLLEQHKLNRKIAKRFPEAERQALVRHILDRIAHEVQTYVWLKTLISAATGIACYAVMKAVGLDFAE